MSAFPTLSRAPSYPLDPDGTKEDAVLRAPMEGGYAQSRPKFTRLRRSWGINYLLPDADRTTLETFEGTTLRNGADSFTWTHPLSGTTYTVQMAAPIKYSRADQLPGWSRVSFLLQEV